MEKHNPVNRDHRVILGDDFLPRNIKHLLHHVDLAAHPVNERHDEVKARQSGVGVTPKTLNRVDKALPNDGDPHEQKRDGKHHQK